MALPFKKFGYKLNPITDEIETPQIFLVTKQLKKIGELYPVQDLKITINEVNQPDEVSFTYYKEIDNEPCPYFDKLVDLSAIQVGNYGFFEIAVNKSENSSILKTVTAQSLGMAELSQILATLEINSDEDMAREGEYRYDENYPTVFYRDIDITDSEEIQKKKKDSSLLDRILTYAPHYKVGDVSPTLKNVQRTFSWSDTDIVSILNDVATEIDCIFDIRVTINEDGEAERTINAYDMQYCVHCWNDLGEEGQKTSDTSTFRNIVNGVCQNCGFSQYVKDIGEDTNIFISTENLSDDLFIEGDKDSIKNCFKVVGGDDLMTATVQGLNMSANNRIMMFSEEQQKLMSKSLIDKLGDYEEEYEKNLPKYQQLLETQYNIYDMILYLQSGKMPLLEKEITKTPDAIYQVISQITTYYNNRFYISSWENYDYTAAKSSIRNLFTTFMPEGFSFTIDTDNLDITTDYVSTKQYHWYGTIKIYSTDNKDDYYTITVKKDSVTNVTHGKTATPYVLQPEEKHKIIQQFSVTFNFADKDQDDYMAYLKQHTSYLLSEVDLTYDNEKAREWDQYSYNRLESYYDGFKTCIETLDDMPNEINTTEIDIDATTSTDILTEMRDNYTRIQNQIQSQMSILLDQIFALNTYLGEYSSEFTDSNGNVWYTLKNFSSVSEALAHMIDANYMGGYATNSDGTVNETSFTPNQFIGTKPCKCKKCNSINVSVTTEGSNICNNCGSKEVYSYLDIMNDIVQNYEENKVTNPNSSIAEMRQEMQNDFDIQTYFHNDALYQELLSFTREDVYTNDNYTSDGLTNSQLISQAKELTAKAKQELSKACMTQYTVTAPISAIVAQTPFEYQGVMVNDDYSGFILNNYVRVRIDDEICEMRIASINLNFPITDKIDVTFTNVSRYNNGTMSDVASILESASNMATSYSYVATQAEKGQQANNTFETIKNEGLDAGLMAVKGGRDQDVVIDNHGILIRKKIQEINDYSKYQMKIINRNIVLTDDYWQNARMAIGLGKYDGKPYYGVWADLIFGNLLAGNKLKIYGGGDGTTDNATVIIDGSGITLDGGAITWTNPISSDNAIDSNAVTGLDEFKNAVQGSLGVTKITSDSVISPKIGGGYLCIADENYSVEIDPNKKSNDTKNGYLFCVKKKENDGTVLMGVDTNGKGYFSGEIEASSGHIGGWQIKSDGWLENNGTTSIFNDCGIKWNNDTYYASLNQSDWEMGGQNPRSVYFRVNTYGSDLNSNDSNCLYCNLGYLDLRSNGRINLYSPDSIILNGATTLNGIATLKDVAKFNSGIRLQASDSNYTELGVNALDSTAINTYFLVKSSMSVRNRLQVGYNDGNIYPTHTFAVNGTSFVTGTSYTNSGTTVTSDRNKKNSISSPSDNYTKLFDALEFKQFKYNDGSSDRFHLGVIAQELEEAMNKVGISSQDFGGLVIDEQGNYFVRYDEINVLTALKVKQLENRISELEEKLNELKSL